MCVAGLQMRADRCGRRHVGLRGKSFKTKMLEVERESIGLNSMCEGDRKTIGKRERREESRGVTVCQHEPLCTGRCCYL